MASSTGRTVFFPAGSPASMVPELGNQVQVVVSVRRELFPPVDPTFNSMKPGTFFGQMSAALNAVLTAAIMKPVAVYWETVYDEGLPDWEQCNPGTPPGDAHCIGFRLHIVGPMHEIGGLTEDLNDMLDNAGQALAQRRPAQGPPLPGSIITANAQGVWKLAVFSQQAMPIASDEKVEAIFLGDQTFDEWCRQPGNETSLLARLSVPTQARCEQHPTSPFSKAWNKQKLNPSSSGQLFHSDVWRRGFVLNMRSVARKQTTMVNKKTSLPYGFDYLFCSNISVLLPHIRPGKDDIQDVFRRLNMLGPQAPVPDVGVVNLAPSLRLPAYDGPAPDVEAGNPNIGTLYLIEKKNKMTCKQQQFTPAELDTLSRVYEQQMVLAFSLRNGIDELPRKTLQSIAGQVHRVSALWQRATDKIPGLSGALPEGVQPVLSELQNEIGRIDQSGSNKLDMSWCTQPFHAVFENCLAAFCREIRQHAKTQLLVVIFSCLCQMTVTCSKGHGTTIMTYGPPGSGKSDLQRTVELILGNKVVKRQDYMSEAAQRSAASVRDGRLFVEDEAKPKTDAERLIYQTTTGGADFCVTTTVKGPVFDSNGNQTGWENQEQTFPLRAARVMTTNTSPTSLTDAERSRQMSVLLPQEHGIDRRAAQRAALHPEQLRESINKICDTFTSAQRVAAWDALLLPNADWNTYILRVFILYAKHFENGFMDERKWSRIRDFAIGAQMLMLDHLLHRIPIDWGLSDDEKVVISMCNRYCNPQALCMAWCIHNQLADNGSHYADWVATLKEMIAVTDGAVETRGGFYRIRDIKVSRGENPVDRLNKAVLKIGAERGFKPGTAYMKQAFEETTQGPAPPLKNDDDGWWISAVFANGYNSWNERVLLAAIKENLDERQENEDDMHPFPKASPMVQNEKLVRVDQVLAQIREPIDGMGSRQAAAAAMKQADVDRALVLLSIRKHQGVELLIKTTGPVYMARYLTGAEYTSLPEIGPNSQAKCKKSHVRGMYVMKRETPVESPMLMVPDLLATIEDNKDQSSSDMAEAFLAACGSGYNGSSRLVGVTGPNADPVAVSLDRQKTYAVALPNPSWESAKTAHGGFSRRSQFKHLSNTSIWGSTDRNIEFSSDSNIERKCFLANAADMGLDKAESERLAENWTTEAMIRRAEAQAVDLAPDSADDLDGPPDDEAVSATQVEQPPRLFPPVQNPFASGGAVPRHQQAGGDDGPVNRLDDGASEDYGAFSVDEESLPSSLDGPASRIDGGAPGMAAQSSPAPQPQRARLRRSASPEEDSHPPAAVSKRPSVQSDSEDDEIPPPRPKKPRRRNPFIDDAAEADTDGDSDGDSDSDGDVSDLIDDSCAPETEAGPMHYQSE